MTLEQHLLAVEEVLEIFHWRKLYAKNSNFPPSVGSGDKSSALWGIACQLPAYAGGSEEGVVDPGTGDADVLLRGPTLHWVPTTIAASSRGMPRSLPS